LSIIDAREQFTVLVAALASRPGVSLDAARKKAFGPTALCVNRHIFAMLSADGQFVVKLPMERVDALVAAGLGAHFEPSHGQWMQSWFVAGAGLEQSWLALAEEALTFAEGSQTSHD
jgi:hypothetical protein